MRRCIIQTPGYFRSRRFTTSEGFKESGIIRGEKRGYFTHYRVKSTALEKLSSHLSEMIQMSHSFHGKPCRHTRLKKKALTLVEKIDLEASDE